MARLWENEGNWDWENWGIRPKSSIFLRFSTHFQPFFTHFFYISLHVFLAISHNSPFTPPFPPFFSILPPFLHFPHFSEPLRLVGEFCCV